MDSGQWTVDSGQLTMDNGQWTVDSPSPRGNKAPVHCQLSIVNCLVNCQLSAPATARVLLAALLELQKPTGDTLDIRSVYPQLCP